MISSVFVYGTLKRGYCREPFWPARPRLITSSWTLGSLFRGPEYPAMTVGDDRVLGECWHFEPAQMDRVLQTLDEVEGTNQPGRDDLYVRVQTDVFSLDDRPLATAWVYHYAVPPVRHGFRPITQKSTAGYVAWPETGSP
jgi:gamma-glutamylcyclotransferase (GGCT)/AIG2-like uncharacterized protein YtfP